MADIPTKKIDSKYGWFRMKYLPKPEYELLKRMVEVYGCDGDRELIMLAIRMLTLHDYREIITHLEWLRSTHEAEREIELQDMPILPT